MAWRKIIQKLIQRINKNPEIIKLERNKKKRKSLIKRKWEMLKPQRQVSKNYGHTTSIMLSRRNCTEAAALGKVRKAT